MPTNYQESTVTGSKWKRANRVVIENPYNNTPSVLFVEEEVVDLGVEGFLQKPVSNVFAMFDMQGSFPLINPETGVATGSSMNHSDLYVALHSLYIHLATERDAQQQAPV